MLNMNHWEIAAAPQEWARQHARKRNAAFRHHLQRRKERQREKLKLKLAMFAAMLAWLFAGVQCWR